ncbi:MAG TPA: uroporphyrinogen-III synthase [Gemmatimonadales bacterium]|nr:uroporphyrinogen-III synthase [Gemmatimonadales bacterium]
MERVVITASSGSFPGLADALSGPGRTVAAQPLIRFEAPTDWAPLDQAIDRIHQYPAVALTSPRAATSMITRMLHRGIGWPRVDAPRVWAAGAATAAALAGTGAEVQVADEREVGSRGAAAALAQVMLDARVEGPVLFPCGSIRRELLPQRLRSEGVRVDEVEAYRSVLAERSEARAAVSGATVLIVASPSVVHLLVGACPPGARPDLVAVGPTTADAARSQGWEPAAIATHPGRDAVVAAVNEALARRSVS